MVDGEDNEILDRSQKLAYDWIESFLDEANHADIFYHEKLNELIN